MKKNTKAMTDSLTLLGSSLLQSQYLTYQIFIVVYKKTLTLWRNIVTTYHEAQQILFEAQQKTAKDFAETAEKIGALSLKESNKDEIRKIKKIFNTALSLSKRFLDLSKKTRRTVYLKKM